VCFLACLIGKGEAERKIGWGGERARGRETGKAIDDIVRKREE